MKINIHCSSLFVAIAIIVCVCGVQHRLSAQINNYDLDTTIGVNKFSDRVYGTVVQADGKIIVVGAFKSYETVPVGGIVRLNPDGSLDATFAQGGGNEAINKVALQADGKIIIGGWFTQYRGSSANRIARLNSDGTLDNTFNAVPESNAFISSVTPQSNGKVLVGGYFSTYGGVARKNIVRLNSDGSLDVSFNPGSGANNYVNVMKVLLDGRILVGGDFTTFNGVSKKALVCLNSDGSIDNSVNVGTGFEGMSVNSIRDILVMPDNRCITIGIFLTYNGVSRKGIARLNQDGSLDTSFDPGVGVYHPTTWYSTCGILLSNGKIILAGQFTKYNNVNRGSIVRVNANGSIDNTFDPGAGTGEINSVALQADGRIVLGGYISTVDDIGRAHLARLKPDGALDKNFMFSTGIVSGIAHAIAQTPDGKIMIGGYFSSCYNTKRKNIARLNADRTLDVTFDPGSGVGASLNEWVYSLAVQPDGKVLIGGTFTTYNGTAQSGIARVNTDGSIDATFNSGTGLTGYTPPSNRANKILLQPDGKIILAGVFTKYNGTTRNFLVRLNTDGTLDSSFDPGTGPNNTLETAVLQPDGKILIAGSFTAYNGTNITRVARINADGSLDNSFNPGTGPNNKVLELGLQSDGKVIIGGSFSSYPVSNASYLVRLNSDGTLDNSFAATNHRSHESIAIQSDNKILIVGSFSSYGVVERYGIARLNTDGTVDNSFNPNFQQSSYLSYVTILPNGKIALGGTVNYKSNGFTGVILLGRDVSYANTIEGKVYTEENKDCIHQVSESPVSSVVVKAMPGEYYGGSDAFGNYTMKVDSGTAAYTVSQKLNPINSQLFVNQCATSQTVNVSGANSTFGSYDFADSIRECSFLNINIQSARMRRCFPNKTFVRYCNYGNKATASAQVKIEYPPYLYPVSSTPAWTARVGNALIFDVGTLDAQTCGTITTIDSVICGNEGIRGSTQCLKATISPSTDCEPENPGWDQSSIRVSGSCISDSATFIISNIGEGNMDGSRDYRLFVNDTLAYTNIFTINSGEQFIVKYPGEGNTIRLEADQHPLHKGKSKPRATAERCGANNPVDAQQGLVTTAPLDDLDEEVAYTCSIVLDSYDPNDKQTLPTGTGVTKQVVPGQELEYTVRFQNTGTDVAYKIVIVDTLDEGLDAESFVEGVASHPYTLKISGKGKAVLTYTFNHINLPDSASDKAGSNGLVSFRIKLPNNAPLGSVVQNKAFIYFDYNSAIITNETMHTVGVDVEEDLSKGAKVSVGQPSIIAGLRNRNNGLMKVYPNPTNALLNIETYGNTRDMEIRFLDVTGVVRKSLKLSNANYHLLNVDDLNDGMYTYELWQSGERKTNGQLVILGK